MTHNDNEITRLAGRLDDVAHLASIGYHEASDLRRAAELLRGYDAQMRSPALTEQMHHDHLAMEALRSLSCEGPGGVHVCLRSTPRGRHSVVRVASIEGWRGFRRSGDERVANLLIDAANEIRRMKRERAWAREESERVSDDADR